MAHDQSLRVVVIGAGAAGLMAAAEAARCGASVLLIEKNSKTGVKILMSGGTRCNLTHHAGPREIAQAFGHACRFLQPTLGAFPPADVVQMFHQSGVPTKVEATGKVFPVSNRALHVRDALVRRATDAGVRIETGLGVLALTPAAEGGWKIATVAGEIEADRVVVTAGGRSWPGCGTTGDAYAWLRDLGHTIVEPRPALVPLTGGTEWMHALSGVTLEDCLVSVIDSHLRNRNPSGKRKPVVNRRSSFLFTHFGFSGPAAMDISGSLTAAESFADREVLLDLLPGWDLSRVRHWIADRQRDGGRQRVASRLATQLPMRLASALAQYAGADCMIAEMSRRVCGRICESLKRLPLDVDGTLGFDKAEVTAGGVALAEVDPRTMQSRLASGLYIAGEVLDVDGPIGGYNFQAAFSTGRAAGIAAARR